MLITVGYGISPYQSCIAGVADYTAGGEFHPAPKYLQYYYIICTKKVKIFVTNDIYAAFVFATAD